MTKKSKRQVRKVASADKTAPARVVSSAPRRSAEQSFNPDYSYVIKDLKRIGTLASTFFLVLIILSFFLRG